MTTGLAGASLTGRRARRKAALAQLRGVQGRMKAGCGPAMTASNWLEHVQDVREFTAQWEDVLPGKLRTMLGAAIGTAEGVTGNFDLACSVLQKDLQGVLEAFPPTEGFAAMSAPAQAAVVAGGILGVGAVVGLAAIAVIAGRLLTADRVPLNLQYSCPQPLSVSVRVMGIGVTSLQITSNTATVVEAPALEYRVTRAESGVTASAKGARVEMPVGPAVALSFNGTDVPVGADMTMDLRDRASHELRMACG